MSRRISVIIIFTILLGLIFMLAGCGQKAEKSDIEEYLKKEYPKESFNIISQKKVDEIPVYGNVNSKHEGNEYRIISNDTKIEFCVSDVYEFNSYGTGNYLLKNDYKKCALERYIEEFDDKRIKRINDEEPFFDTNYIYCEIKDFESIEEMSNVLYKFKIFCENKYPFIESDYKFMVCVYKDNTYKTSIILSDEKSNITVNDIQDNLLSIE